MIENLVDSINLLLAQHPNMLHLMFKLFWLKYWILMGLMARFIYLAYSGSKPQAPQIETTDKPEAENIFIA